MWVLATPKRFSSIDVIMFEDQDQDSSMFTPAEGLEHRLGIGVDVLRCVRIEGLVALVKHELERCSWEH